MITKITIGNIPPFKDNAILETDKKVNLIYGLNGTGKSTLSNVLYNVNQGIVPDGVKIDCDNGNEKLDLYELIVYNQQFIQDNFYESSEIKGIFSLSQDNASAQAVIDEANKAKLAFESQKADKTTEKTNIESEKNRALGDIQNKMWEIKTNYSGQNSPIDYCLYGLKGEKAKLFEYIKSIKKTADPPKRGVDELKTEIVELNRDDAQTIESVQKIDIQLDEIEQNSIFTKVIVGNENSSISGLIKELKNSDWVRQGMKFIHSEHDGNNQQCPFCQQMTISKEFVNELESYFGGAYEQDVASLKSLLSQYQTEKDKIVKSEAFDNYSILQTLKADYESAYNKLILIINGNIGLIEKKITTPSVLVNLKDSKEKINSLNDIIELANEKIKEYNQRIKQKDAALQMLKTEFWNVMRWKYDAALVSYLQLDNERNKKIATLDKNISDFDAKIKEKESVITEYQKKTINIDDAIKNINDALIDMGIADFKIVKYSDSLYKLHREGQKDDVFKSLSEGEKMIISLLYFIERCKGKTSKEGEEKKKVVIIDDPISSLSHIYVYNVGRLILQEFTDANPNNKNVCKYEQVFLLTHSLYFFYEMAIIKRNDKDNDDYNQKLFRIQKSQQGSHIYEMKYSEIQNDYHAYWMIIKDQDAHPALIANCMRNIIEYFFSFVEKKELNNVFNEKELQLSKFRAFNRYINRESHSIGQNIFDIKEFNYNDFKDAFELVFKLTGYEDRYKRMMK